MRSVWDDLTVLDMFLENCEERDACTVFFWNYYCRSVFQFE